MAVQPERPELKLPGQPGHRGGAPDADDASERALRRVRGLDDATASARMGIASGGLAYWVAAARECFEESGILLAHDADGRPVDPGRAAALEPQRQALNAGTLLFSDFLEAEDLWIHAQEIAYYSHWITAPGRPRRFSTRFFIACAPAGQDGAHDQSETVHSVWVSPREAIERGKRKEIKLIFPTRSTLSDLAGFRMPREILAHAQGLDEIPPIHPVDYDQVLIEADRWLFGVDPTVWLFRFAHPVVTEVLQIAYSSYYLLFLILGIEIYRKHTLKSLDKAGFLIVYGFFLSYLGYFLLPAIGPRFTLHDFHLLSDELPGLFLTEPLRAFVNFGESIPTDIPNPADVVQRDVFPSGHTQLSLIVAYLGFHFKLSSRWVLAVLTGLLIVGTVYLRYHYFVDVIAGMLFFWFTVWSGHHIETWWLGKRHVFQND